MPLQLPLSSAVERSVLYHRLTYAAWKAIHALGTPSAWPMSEALIESRQFIGWWRDAAQDALTSSAYTGDVYRFLCLHEAFILPFGFAIFLAQIPYFERELSICTSATAYSGTLFSLRRSAMEYRHGQPPCARFIARDDPHSAALKQFMPRRTRDHSTPSSSLSREQSLPRKEPSGGSGRPGYAPPPTTVWGARGRSFPRQRPRRRGDLKRPNRPAASAPPSRSWPSGRNEESRFTTTRRGQTVKAYLPAIKRALLARIRGHSRFSLQRTDPVPATCQSSTSLSINPNNDAEGFPSWWRASLLPGLLNTPSRYVFPARHLCFLHRISFTNGSVYRGYRCGFSAQIRSGYTLQLGEIPPRFDGVQLTVVNSTSKASVLQQELSSPYRRSDRRKYLSRTSNEGSSAATFLVPKRDVAWGPFWICGVWIFPFTKFKMLTMKTIMSQIQGGDWFVTIDLKMRIFTSRSFSDTGGSFGLPLEGRLTNKKSCPSAWPWRKNVHKMHGCCTGPFEAPGHSCADLSGRLAHSGSHQGAGKSSQRYHSPPHPFSWPQNERQEECAPPVSGGSLDSIQMQARLAPAGYPILQHVWPASS